MTLDHIMIVGKIIVAAISFIAAVLPLIASL